MNPIIDEFRGDDERLRQSIEALIRMEDDSGLAPHGIGGHARALLASCYHRLAARPEAAVQGMTLELPFEPGDTVFYMEDNQVTEDTVRQIMASTTKEGVYGSFKTRFSVYLANEEHGREAGEFWHGMKLEKCRFFTTKKALLESL